MHVANRHVERWAPEWRPLAASARCATSGSSIASSRRGSRPRSARRRCACSASTCRRARRERAAPAACRGCSRVPGTRTSSTGWRPLARSTRSRRRAAPRRRRCSRRAARTSRRRSQQIPSAPRAAVGAVRVRRAVAVGRAPASRRHGSNAYSPLVPVAAAHAAHVMTSAIAPLVRSASVRTARNAAARTVAGPARRAHDDAPALCANAGRADRDALVGLRARDGDAACAASRACRCPPRARLRSTSPSARRSSAHASPSYSALPSASIKRALPPRRRDERMRRPPHALPRFSSAPPSKQARREEARQADVRRDQTASTERAAAVQAERARLEERIAQRVAERTRQQEGQRLHETAREAAARDARIAASADRSAGCAATPPPKHRASRLHSRPRSPRCRPSSRRWSRARSVVAPSAPRKRLPSSVKRFAPSS